MKKMLLLAVVLVACGGHKSQPQDPSGPSVMGVQDTGDPNDHSGNMVPAEKMDEIQTDLKRKEQIISRCLADAIDAGEAKKNTHGKVVVELVVDTSGHPQDVKILKTDFQAASISECVKKHVEDIAFPQIPKQYPTSYTYAMEAD